jgi:hypothetical protein
MKTKKKINRPTSKEIPPDRISRRLDFWVNLALRLHSAKLLKPGRTLKLFIQAS